MNKNYVCNNRLPERGNKIRERPIWFSGAMVRAILEGRKTMTRRVVKPQPHARVDAVKWQDVIITGCNTPDQSGFAMMRGCVIESEAMRCPYGTPGDLLWVRETFWHRESFHGDYLIDYRYCATEPTPPGSIDPNDYDTLEGYWRKMPSIFMPRETSRITLEVTGVRVERLLEISEQDAIAEGVQWPKYDDFEPVTIDGVTSGPARIAFKELWSNINSPESWDANPWVWVVEFRKVENGGCCESSTHQDEK